jgi:hypothetical protein
MSDRKYRQRGYKDDDRQDGGKRPRRQGASPERREGPRGRGLGAPNQTVFRCADCGKRVAASGGVEVGQKCPHCEADLHSCVNCQHFDPSARWQCRQDIPQPVPKKRKDNECALFSPKVVVEFESEAAARSPEEARAAFDDLFNGL